MPCTPGSYCEILTGSNTEHLSPAGYYMYNFLEPSASAKNNCPAGYYCDEGAITPTKCPTGFYCTEFSTSQAMYDQLSADGVPTGNAHAY